MSVEIPAHVRDRLADEQTIWLTTAKSDGTPLPNPVWFLWRDGEFLVFTIPDSVKMKNMERNPRVALNFNSASLDGSDVDIFQAEAEVNSAPASDAEVVAYLKKYDEGLKLLGLTRETLVEGYRAVRMKTVKYRTVAG